MRHFSGQNRDSWIRQYRVGGHLSRMRLKPLPHLAKLLHPMHRLLLVLVVATLLSVPARAGDGGVSADAQVQRHSGTSVSQAAAVKTGQVSDAGVTGNAGQHDGAPSRYSKLAPDPRKNWFYKKQAAYAAIPGFDPYKPGYSDDGSKSGLPARNPNYDRKYDHEARLRQLGSDPKTSSADRGWIRQEINRVDRNRSLPVKQRSGGDTLRMPPGKQLAHERGRENHKGYGFVYAKLQDADLHRLQHTGALDHRWDYHRDMNNPDVGGDQWGRRLKERVPDAYKNPVNQSQPAAGQSVVRVFDTSAGNRAGPASGLAASQAK